MRFHSQKKKLSWRWGAKHYHSTIHNAKALPLVDDIGTCNSNISRKLTASQPATEDDEDQRGDEEGYADFATCNNEDDDDASDNENGDENENATLDASDQLVDISQRVIPTEVFDTTKKIAPMLLQLWTPQPFKNHLNSTNFPVKLSPISMYKHITFVQSFANGLQKGGPSHLALVLHHLPTVFTIVAAPWKIPLNKGTIERR